MQNPSSPKIVLASGSRYRQNLLDRFLSDYETVVPGVDETALVDEQPTELASRLAKIKAEAAASSMHDALIIGADQLAVLDDNVLGKPGDHHKAVEQLLAATGKTVTFLTAVCVLDPVTRRRFEHTDKTSVQFRQFDRRLADSYLRHDEPYDCAGSFKIEGAGFVLFESVTTDDPTALIGLPMIWLAGTLRELGYLLP
ncbi:MAG: Maf family protein [Woeseiaceae bacterium]|jgi:septum formation protein|nr:Maf family protein [Woeseiaceae bacterium]|tara:strand:+ start:1141 stop:1734 length:594 start_codon:yes stop_codon:yes gene_type:complete